MKTTNSIENINITTCPFGLGLLRVCILSLTFPFFFFSKRMNSNNTVHAHGFTIQEKNCTIHRTYNHFILKKILKMGPTSLFTHLKIILQQCFQFLVFCKICCIRTDPTYFENQTIDCMFFIFLAHMLGFVLIGYYLLYDA